MTVRTPRRERADVLLVERGLSESRTLAQSRIMAKAVWSGERRVEKAGERLPSDAPLEVRERSRYVSRGGEKLERALVDFAGHGLKVAGCTAVDVGASTGGFTDCLLQHGAARVFAVDVGWGQLHPKLRADSRVVVMERTNARTLDSSSFGVPIDLVVVDASFIGVAKLMPSIAGWTQPGAELVVLVKPQFEAGREEAARGRGVIRDPAVRAAAIGRAIGDVESSGFTMVASTDSPLPGPRGNLEHLVFARRAG